MNGERRRGFGICSWVMVFLFGALAALVPLGTVQAALDCGPDPCPGTLPAIWPHPSKTMADTVRILGWNLAPATTYEIVLVQPDGVAAFDGTVTTDVEGDILGRYEGLEGQPFVCTPPLPILEGVYEVRLYQMPWSRSLDEIPLASTTFYHN